MNKIRYYKDLIFVLTQKEMKLRYKSSFLGYIWSIAHPLALAFVFFIAFKVIMKIQMENYTLFIITGLFPWQWFSNSVNFSPKVLLANSSIIKKVNFPKTTLIAAMVLQDTIHFVLSLPVIILFMLVYNQTPALSWLYGIPILLCIQVIMTYGITLMVSSVNLFFRDLERLIVILMSLLFYCTPIIYPPDMVPERYHHLINLNPIAPLIISWKGLFLNGTLDASYVLISLAYSLVFLMLGHSVFKRLSWRFAEVL